MRLFGVRPEEVGVVVGSLRVLLLRRDSEAAAFGGLAGRHRGRGCRGPHCARDRAAVPASSNRSRSRSRSRRRRRRSSNWSSAWIDCSARIDFSARATACQNIGESCPLPWLGKRVLGPVENRRRVGSPSRHGWPDTAPPATADQGHAWPDHLAYCVSSLHASARMLVLGLLRRPLTSRHTSLPMPFQ